VRKCLYENVLGSGITVLFEGLLINGAVLLISTLILIKASHLTITNAMNASNASGMGATTIGFVIVSFATSLPELLVSIFSAFGAGAVGVAVGNVLGSNIVNTCLILGICVLMVTMRGGVSAYELMNGKMNKRESESLYFGLFIASMIPLVLIYIREASRVVGAVLLTLFIGNTYQMVRANPAKTSGPIDEAEHRRLSHYMSMTIIGIIGVVVSSYFLVDSASSSAALLGVPSLVIGATIVAFGTSLPELATSIEATRQGHIELAFGNVVGSGFVNLTCILGVSLVSTPFTVNILSFHDLAIFSLIANVFLWYFMSSSRINRREGLVLIFLYAAFLFATFGGYRA
jgi:cation:H+ antiporter